MTHPSVRAAGFALNIFIIHALGDVISPVVIGIMSDRGDMNKAFMIVGLDVPRRRRVWLFGARFLERDRRNTDLFAATTAALSAGGAIAIFPEGTTQPEPALQPPRTGTARMLLDAEITAGLHVALLPVGLAFDRPGTFRSGRALVLIGVPVATADLPAGAPPARALTDRLAEALRRLIIEADDRTRCACSSWSRRCGGRRKAQPRRSTPPASAGCSAR